MISLLALFWAPYALAQDVSCAEPLGEEALVSALEAGTAAIMDGDPDAHIVVTDKLMAALPCLDFVPKPEQWAEIMLGVAIVAFHEKEDWQSPLATALTIDPSIDRLVGPNHGFYDWQPPPKAPPTNQVAPEGTRVFYDGLIVSKIPQPTGIHLVQRRDGDGLQTRLLRDESIPDEWLVAPEVASKKRDLGWGVVGVGGGVQLISQAPDQAGNFAPKAGETGAGGVASTHGFLRLVSGFGLSFGAAGQTSEIGTLDARVGPAWTASSWTVSATGAMHKTSVITGDVRQAFLLLYPSAGVAYRQGLFTLSGDAGFAPAIIAANGRLDVAMGTGSIRPMASLRTHVSRSQFVIESTNERALPTTESGARIEIGFTWGKRP